jgi:hypothetical protein
MARETTDAKMPIPQFDLVPEMPLEEYVQNFRYVPPIEPDEVTMRGEAAVLDSEPPAPANTVPVAPVEIVTASAEATPRRSDDDVRERLVLEVTGTAEERSDRPRFLDFNEPSAAAKPMELEAPVAGPAFLGPSDTSAGATTDATGVDVEEPSRGRWRIWMATAAVLVFGVLGVLEWRAQVRQTNNGPIEVIRMKMRGLGNPSENAGNQSSSPGAASDSTSKPVMQAEPPSEAQKQNSSVSGATTGAPTDAGSVSNSNAASAPPASPPAGPPASAGTQTAGGVTSAAEGNAVRSSAQAKGGQSTPAATTTTTRPAADKPKLTASQQPETGAAAAAKPKPSPKTADSDDEVTVKKAIPGGEEVAKANNASDSAAEAAWLWKATAKGNPDAPVRLADMYVKGDGVPRSCEQAMVLLKTAATKENALARNRMASLYSSGTCVQRNRVEAYRWLSSALVANPNSEWARQNRETLWQQMTPEERTQAQKYR